METRLERIHLKSGEPMDVIKTTAPEPAWVDRILHFLHHKGDLWLEPMRRAYTEGLDDLVMSDFLGVLGDGEVVGNITVIEHLGVGILQHVFTHPDHRRKGICQALMAAVCADFRARGGRAMFLGTGYDTPPYHIYASFGFRGRGDSGKMTWLVEEDFDRTWFAPGPTTIRETRWSDNPLLEALYAVTGQWQLKSYHYQQFGHAGFESQYLQMRRDMDEGRVLDVKILATASGAVVGHAMVAEQPQWKQRVLVLDLMMHANFYAEAERLISHLTIPSGRKVQAFCDDAAEAKITALEAVGFEQEGRFHQQMEDENHQLRDVIVLGKST